MNLDFVRTLTEKGDKPRKTRTRPAVLRTSKKRGLKDKVAFSHTHPKKTRTPYLGMIELQEKFSTGWPDINKAGYLGRVSQR